MEEKTTIMTGESTDGDKVEIHLVSENATVQNPPRTYTADQCKHRKTKWCKECLAKIAHHRESLKDIAGKRLGTKLCARVYVASPFTYRSRIPLLSRFIEWRRFRAVCRWTSGLIKSRPGVDFYSPIAHSYPISRYGLPGHWGYWEIIDKTILATCDRMIVLMFRGWEKSKGLRAEIKIAEALGIPIEYINDGKDMETS